jgi:hypothetical protein
MTHEAGGPIKFSDAFTALLHAAGLTARGVSNLLARRAKGETISKTTVYDWAKGFHLPIDEKEMLLVVEPLLEKAKERQADFGIAPKTIEEWLRLYNAARGQTYSPRPPIGHIPDEPSAFQPRLDARNDIEAARPARPGTPDTLVLSGGGGTGKSQLAAYYARQALAEHAYLVAWVPAATVDSIIASYAEAAVSVNAVTETSGDVTADAREFMNWGANTPLPWLVVLDNVTDPGILHDWCPASYTGAGRVLVTTRRRAEPALTGGARNVVNIDVYDPQESLAYLRQRLSAGPQLLDHSAEAVARELGHLPLGLSFAAGYMELQAVTCSQYLTVFTNEKSRLSRLLPEHGDSDGYSHEDDGHREKAVEAALALSVRAANNTREEGLQGLAWPAARLAAVLDPAGHPEELWTTDAVAAYLTQCCELGAADHAVGNDDNEARPKPLDAEGSVDPEKARSVMRLLHRYSVVTHDRGESLSGLVRMHSLTQRAVRELSSPEALTHALLTGADGVKAIWPMPIFPSEVTLASRPSQLALESRLRANTYALIRRQPAAALFDPSPHLVLYTMATSLRRVSMLTDEDHSIPFLRELCEQAEEAMSTGHRSTLELKRFLAWRLVRSGNTTEAIAGLNRTIGGGTQGLDPIELGGRIDLIFVYAQAGHADDAIKLIETTIHEVERTGSPEDWVILLFLIIAILVYIDGGRRDEAWQMGERVVAFCVQNFGSQVERIIAARIALAFSYVAGHRFDQALQHGEIAAADIEQARGTQDAITLAAWAMVDALREAPAHANNIWVKLAEAALQSVRDSRGASDPVTLAIRAALACLYTLTGQDARALLQANQVVGGLKKTRGNEDPFTLAALVGRIFLYVRTGNDTEAVSDARYVARTLSDTRGEEDPFALAASAGLACLYVKRGQDAEAIPIAARLHVNLYETRGEAHPFTLAALAGFIYLHVRNGQVQTIIKDAEAYVSDFTERRGEADPVANTARVGLAYLYAKNGQLDVAIAIADNIFTMLDGWLGSDEQLSPKTLVVAEYMPLMLSHVYREAREPSRLLGLANYTAESFRREERPGTLATIAAGKLATELRDLGYDDSARELAQLVTRRYDEIELPMTQLNFFAVGHHLAELYDLAGLPDRAATIRERNTARWMEGIHSEGTAGSVLFRIISDEL